LPASRHKGSPYNLIYANQKALVQTGAEVIIRTAMPQ